MIHKKRDYRGWVVATIIALGIVALIAFCGHSSVPQ